MEALSLTNIPTTPASIEYESATPSPSSTATRTTSSPPESSIDRERNSCETAIVTIFSMYGDTEGGRGSWPASVPNYSDKDDVAITSPKDIELALPENYRNSFFLSNGYVSSELASADPPSNHRKPFTRTIDILKSSPTSSSVSLASNGPRPASRNTPSPLGRIAVETANNGRPSPGPRFQERPAMTASWSEPASFSEPRPRSSHSRPPRSRPPSQYRNSDISYRDQPLPPVPSPSPRRTPPPKISSPPTTPEPFSAFPLSSPSPRKTSPPKISSTPTTQESNPMKSSSSGAQSSPEPSDGEDSDAFHVRSTYAQLETFGVRGDGYEEGVERTRARVGTSRASQLNADEALGDGNEKTRELDPKEIETLASLDRYGFFSIPSHDRLVLLPSLPLAKRLSRTKAGPSTAPCNAKSLESVPRVSLPPKENSRISKWNRMLRPGTRDQGSNVETWDIKSSKEGKLRERTYKGIPDRWRNAVWGLLMNRFSKTDMKQMSTLAADYRESLDNPSTYDIQIDLDVPRTISGHVMFRTRYGAGQRALFHVLHCLSLRCHSCGYVQGMGPIAATLLCYFDPERVYACLVRLHDAYSMHSIFMPGFPGLLEAIYIQERIIEQMLPDVYAAFQKHTISTTSYATKWYITLFANSVPFQTQLRLWDVFLLEGQDVFVAVAVAIVWAYRDNITSASANFETVLSLLSSFFVPEDEDSLLSWIEKTLGDKKLRSNMARWREQWKDLVASGQDGSALL